VLQTAIQACAAQIQTLCIRIRNHSKSLLNMFCKVTCFMFHSDETSENIHVTRPNWATLHSDFICFISLVCNEKVLTTYMSYKSKRHVDVIKYSAMYSNRAVFNGGSKIFWLCASQFYNVGFPGNHLLTATGKRRYPLNVSILAIHGRIYM